jgi:alpha-tubulin suppressor-like RCC1 family protein
VAAGDVAACVLSSGAAVSCLGDDSHGAVGDGQSGIGIDVSTPKQIIASQVKAVSMGYAFGCALDANGQVACWGDDNAGQIGPGGDPDGGVVATPTLVSGLSPIGVIATGTADACALSVDASSVSCWGFGEDGELGDGMSGTGHDRATPGRVLGLPSRVSTIVAGGAVNCAISMGGDLWCWGWNGNAQLGTGTPGDPVTTPAHVTGVSSVTQAAVGLDQEACAITTGGATYCWGVNLLNPIAPDGGINHIPPTLVTGIPAAAELAVGDAHVCILGIDSTVWCWGANDVGQCGPLATGSVVATPVQVPF